MSRNIQPPENRFWSKVNKSGVTIEKIESCCWEYTPLRGYTRKRSAYFNFGSDKYGHKCMEVGRVSWIISHNGEDIPRGTGIIRRCGNYRCIRPDHLLFGKPGKMLGVEVIDKDGNKWKRCTGCGKVLLVNIENFGFGGWRGNFLPKCRSCSVKQAKKSAVKRWEQVALYRAMDQSKNKNLVFDLTREFILELFDRQNGLCYWLGIPMLPSVIHRYPFHPSLDRLDRNKGYTKDNVVLCCQFMNVGRNSCSYNDFVTALQKHPDVFGKGLWNNG